MIPLPATYSKHGYTMTLHYRTDDIAVYSQRDPETDQVYGYEVFIIQKFEDRTMFGNVIPARESVPPSEKWGTEAYTVRDGAQIVRLEAILAERLKQRRQNAFKRETYSENRADQQTGEGTGAN